MFEWIGALTVTMIVCAIVLMLAERIQHWLGERAVMAFERLMGLVLVAISVEMMLADPSFVHQLTLGDHEDFRLASVAEQQKSGPRPLFLSPVRRMHGVSARITRLRSAREWSAGCASSLSRPSRSRTHSGPALRTRSNPGAAALPSE